MNLSLTLVSSLLFALAGMAAAEPAQPADAAIEDAPASDLIRLERSLTEKLEAKQNGQVTPEAFSEFVGQFRVDLAATEARVRPTPANTGIHARILARLQELGEAMARLDQALLQEPDNSTLLNARGYVQLQQGDYSGALASANRVLKYNQEHGQPADKGALSIKYSSEGRIVGTSRGQVLTAVALPSQSVAALGDSGKPYKLAVKGSAKPGEVPAVMTGTPDEPAPARGHTPLLPTLILTGAGFTAYGVYKISKSNSTAVSNEGLNRAPNVSPEQVRRNYLNSAVLIGTPILAFGLVYGGPVVLRAAAPVVTSLWQQGRASAQRLATSEAGALFPEKSPEQALQALTGYTRHGINQAISKDGVGVSPKAILDALKFPLEIVKQDSGKTMYVGRNATVVLNQTGKVVTMWANNQKGMRVAAPGSQ